MTVLKKSTATSQTRIISMFLQITALKSKVIKTRCLYGTCYLSVISTAQHVLWCFLEGEVTFSNLHYFSNPDFLLIQILLHLQLLLPPVAFFLDCSTQTPPSLLTPHTCSVTGAPQLLWWVMERASWRSCPHPGPILQISSMDGPWEDRRSLSNCPTLILTQHLHRCCIFTFSSTSQRSDAEISLELQFLPSFSLFWNTEMWNIVHAYVAYYAISLSYTINALKKLSLKQSQESTI